jgi:hypothetical protein
MGQPQPSFFIAGISLESFGQQLFARFFVTRFDGGNSALQLSRHIPSYSQLKKVV